MEGTTLNLKKLVILTFTSVLATTLVACTSPGGNKPDTANDVLTQTGGNSKIGAQELNDSQLSAQDAKNLKAAGFNAKNIIYFDYDSSQLKSDDEQTVERHAQYLLDNPSVKIVLEGHADERGSREYNMALGEKRAYSVKKLLELKGVGKQQVDTVSFGEEKPDIDGHEEQSWSANRRAVFVYASN